jgi:hypothetical protein
MPNENFDWSNLKNTEEIFGTKKLPRNGSVCKLENMNWFRKTGKSREDCLTWSWLADYNHRDVAIAICEIDYRQWRALSSDLEGIILVWSKPPFNIRIPMRDEL